MSMENGAEARVRWGRVCTRVGKEVGAGSVEVASIGMGRVKVEQPYYFMYVLS
jgi:hypothetical protein